MGHERIIEFEVKNEFKKGNYNRIYSWLNSKYFRNTLYVLLFSDLSIKATFEAAVEQGHIGSLLALGALLNLVAFFLFLRIRRDQRAKGVLIATLLTALGIMWYKIF